MNLPSHRTQVIIHHPALFPPDLIMQHLQSLAAKQGTMATAKTTVAALVLPLAFGIDTFVIPGPAVSKA